MKARISVLVISLLLLGSGFFLKTKNDARLNFPGRVAGSQTDFWSQLDPNLPLLPQASLMSVLQKGDDFELTLETTETPLAIEKFYKEKLPEAGWHQQDDGFFKEGKKFSWQIVRNDNQSPSIVLLNYVFVPTK